VLRRRLDMMEPRAEAGAVGVSSCELEALDARGAAAVLLEVAECSVTRTESCELPPRCKPGR
jgi:hypothetical protein